MDASQDGWEEADVLTVKADAAAAEPEPPSPTSTMPAYVVYASICAFAYAGVLLRQLLRLFLSEYGGALAASIGHGFLLQNVAGCFAMGWLKQRERSVGGPPLLLKGLTTGLCGCLTTFASWQLAVGLQLRAGNVGSALLIVALQQAVARSALLAGADLQHWAGSRGRPGDHDAALVAALKELGSVEASIAASKGALGESFAAELAGRYNRTSAELAEASRSAAQLADEMSEARCARLQLSEAQRRGPSEPNARMWLAIFAAASVAAWAAALLADRLVGGGAWAFWLPVAVAPAGAALRHALSSLNGKLDLPMGTLGANVLGSTATAAVYALGGSEPSALAQAASIGFCGSLSTVSTYMTDAQALEQAGEKAGGVRAWLYVVGSVALSQVAVAVVLISLTDD